MTAQEVVELLCTQQDVREFLRGVEEGSETDREAQRAMLAAVGHMRGGGVHDVMAKEETELYAEACLLRTRIRVDGLTGQEADSLLRQYNGIVLILRYDEKNVKEGDVNG